MIMIIIIIRLKLNLTSGCCPRWFIFFKNLFYQNNCIEAMNIGGCQIRGALFNFFVVKKCPLCIFWMLPSVSKIIPGLLIKFGQFMPYYKRKNFIKKFYKNIDLKTSPRFFCVCKELGTTLLENEIFEARYLY